MTSRVLSLLAAFTLLLGVPSLRAQEGTQLLPKPDEENTRVGTRGANFLEVGIGARAMAMGGAVGALAEDVSALYWNPAGIARDPRFAAMFSYNEMYTDFGINHFFGGVTLPIGTGAAGISIISLTSGDIERTTESFPEGDDPQFGKTFNWSSLAIGLSYGRQITDRLVIGATAKFAETGIEGANATFFGGDAGVQFRTGLLGTTLGASLLNLGSSGTFRGALVEQIVGGGGTFFDSQRTVGIELDTRSWDLPTMFTLSVLWDLVGSPDALFAPNPDHNVRVVTEATDAIDTNVQSRLGVEYDYRGIFFVRGGKFFANEDHTSGFRDFGYGLSGGFGVAIPLGQSRVSFDYAYTDRGLLSNIQAFTVEFRK